MIGASDGPPDQLTTVTRPLSGSYYVIPSAGRLATIADADGGDSRVDLQSAPMTSETASSLRGGQTKGDD
jgi:hypothetical protein